MDKKAKIFDVAKTLFYESNFKDISVAEVAKKSDIAVGTFYKNYSSKEELFFDIFSEESIKLKKRVVSSIDLDGDLTSVIKELLIKILDGYNENPILRHWYSSEFRYKLEQKLDFEKVSNECFEFSYNLFIDIVSKWQDEGRIRRDFDKEFILAIFDSISYIDTSKKEIGEQHFPMLLEFIIESIVNGLEVKEESRGN